MLKSLRFRLFLALLLVAVLSVALVALLARLGTVDQFMRYVSAQDQEEQRAIATVIAHQIREGGLESIDPLAGILEQAYDQEITLTGPEGDILYSTTGDLEIVEERIIVSRLDGNEPLQSRLQNEGLEGKSTFPGIEIPGQITTTTRTTRLSGGSEQNFFGSVNRIFILTAVIAVILAALISLLLARRIIKPVKELTAAAARLEAGDLSQRVTFSGSDELGQLATAFNAMAGSLEQQDKLRRHLVTDIAHELRTPLANLYGYLEAIEDGLINPDSPAIKSLMEETLLLNQLVEDLQEISLAEAGELRLEIAPTELPPLINNSVEALLPLAQNKSITIETAVAANLPLVAADPGRLAQILRNLLNNSITHTPENGRIIISAEPFEPSTGSVPSSTTSTEPVEAPANTTPSSSVFRPSSTTSADPFQKRTFILITVQDSGRGIEPEHQEHVFDRFYRADAARSRTTGGSGLGLAISKMLVEAQGGEIWLKSIVGESTTVGFTLPIMNKQ